MPSRRQFLTGLGAAGLAGVAGCAGSDDTGVQPGSDGSTTWPLPDYSPRSTAYASDAAAPRSRVTERWTVSTGRATGRAVIAGGRVFLPTADGLEARSLADGAEEWTLTGERSRWANAPSLVDGTLYATFRGEPGLRALDPATGAERWRVDTRDAIRAGVLPTNEGVVTGDESGRLYEVTPDGTVRATRDLLGAVAALATFAGEVLSVGTRGGQVYSLYHRGDRLQALWRRRVPGAVTDLAAAGGSGVYVTVFGNHAFRLMGGAHAGANAWTVPEMGEHLVAANDVFLTNQAAVTRLDTGPGMGQASTGWATDHGSCAPAAAGDTLYVGHGDTAGPPESGFVAALPLDASGFLGGPPRERFRHDVGGRPVGVSVADGALFVPVHRADGHALLALDSA